MTAPANRVDKGLPLRLSARRGDPYFQDNAVELSDRIDVLVDGVPLEHATSWDVVKNLVVRQRRNPDGSLVLEKGAPTFETLKGEVEVRWRREESGAV